MKVLIVGGGIGGLALGAFLRMYRIEFDIVEKQPYTASQGYLIGLWSNSRQIFQALNLGHAFKFLGRDVETYRLLNGNGTGLRTYDFAEFKEKYKTGLSIFERDAVYQLLLTKVGKDRVRFDESIASIRQFAEGVEVVTTSGARGTYDLVVGADGAHSQLRELFFPKTKIAISTWCSSWIWIDSESFPLEDLTQVLSSACMMVFASSPHKTALNYFYSEKNEREAQKFVATFLKKSGIKEHSQSLVQKFNLRTVDVSRWSKGRVVLLGDAAHCTHPYAGLGASMALEDAFELAQQLLRVDEKFSIERAFVQYQNVREKRLRIMRKATRLMELVTQIKSSLIRSLVNKMIPLLPEALFTRNFKKLFDETLSPQN